MLELPIDPLIPKILESFQKSSQVILTASPGAGKTTRLPPELLKIVKGKIAVLEPRRMATVGAASFIAEERNFQLGHEVGYQVRFESKVSSATRLIFMTDALLLRRLVDDPELNEFEMIVIDEFHERNLNQDLILGIIKELQDLGREIKLMVMSATLDVAALKKFLPESTHIDVPGKVFPLTIKNINSQMKMSTDFEFIQKTAENVLQLHREGSGDILVFLPGVGEINRLHEALEEKKLPRDIFPLHGSLPLSEQRKILKAHDKPRVILSTNIAEASVTVPGVDKVLDTGLARILKVNMNSGFSRLDLNRIAKFNAHQRAGRAARQKEGLCVRMWPIHDEVTQDEQLPPECQRVDLSQTLLLLAHLGISDFSNFSWLDHPPGQLIRMALQNLSNVKALDKDRRITEFGKQLMDYPLPPRWGSLLALGNQLNEGALSAKIAALLQDRDILSSKFEAHSADDCDVTYRLQMLEDVEKGRHVGGVNNRQAKSVLDAADQLERLTKNKGKNKIEPQTIRKLLLQSQSDRLCRRRKEGSEYSARAIMVGGRGVRLAKESQVKQSEFFIALDGMDLPGQADTQISMATGVNKNLVLEILKDQITTFEDVYFDEKKGQFFTRRIRRFQDLDLDEPSLLPIKPEDLGDKFVDALISRWDWIISQNENLQNWMARWKFYSEEKISSEVIRATLEQAAFGKTKMSEVIKENIVFFLESALDKPTLKDFHASAPANFTAATGHQHKIHYQDSEPPFVEVRLQEMFGVPDTPKLGSGKTPLTFKLLAPNFRPVQVTRDIASFWKNTYFEVRKELKSRYPKHSWPDDPLTAPAEAKGRRRF